MDRGGSGEREPSVNMRASREQKTGDKGSPLQQRAMPRKHRDNKIYGVSCEYVSHGEQYGVEEQRTCEDRGPETGGPHMGGQEMGSQVDTEYDVKPKERPCKLGIAEGRGRCRRPLVKERRRDKRQKASQNDQSSGAKDTR